MAEAARVRAFTDQDPAEWTRWENDGQEVAIGEVVGEADAAGLGAGFARFGAGVLDEAASPIPYDEVFVITSGALTVRSALGDATARAGEALFLPRGTAGEYRAEADTAYVCVAHPPYARAWRERAAAAERGEDVPVDPRARLRRLAGADVASWARAGAAVRAGELVGAGDGSALGVALLRWDAAGSVPVEGAAVLAVVRGAVAVRAGSRRVEAGAGGLVHLAEDGVCEARAGTELVAVGHPHRRWTG
ncbi:hypothetical protein CLV72_11036 [Allonocardiopsis opalescens]|uniref:Mannose-6-phosphate isomerase-like protein (Cupin superfamily) n=2 Tax=Allonocardiopsis opalescens TaxID=1144618 RepID=A0A2T0PU74_9ACTN|nr:hypothetical protein CLV72_11036 [Allonocardiopsis opalescens]